MSEPFVKCAVPNCEREGTVNVACEDTHARGKVIEECVLCDEHVHELIQSLLLEGICEN